ncbi:hypothetical protein BCLUESOX_2228 [bacterium endosymbiont of Bathymodiolus sp. 5 South]|nr:hypothetical protein [uncultured Gammaproteobacteria bacterium]SHN91976.1 hypothetical protein BCLUESOX_2228 [bacterium endosymbiont of Bathymodiolus sp. 5 South]VVH63963.1 hypothetical protein BSPWISOX_2374 [uncultured Gammaproteobacteria bacterium]
MYPKSKNRTIQTPNPQSKPKKCTPFKPCLQQNTGIFSVSGFTMLYQIQKTTIL